MLACAALAALCAPAAQAEPAFGVAEDATKYADDGGSSLFARLGELGMSENRMVVYWDVSRPAAIQERAFLDRALPVAAAKGVRVVFAVYPRDPLAFATDTDGRVALFAAYVKLLAHTYPQVRTYVLLNEPNEAFFLSPQRGAGGEIVSAEVALKALAAAYDALKSVDPAITVAGLGLSPEGNDQTSTSPVRFLHALGEAYRRSGRAAPIMDELAFHVYPRDASRHDQATRYDWPNAGAADLDRIKQAVWDAFAGTAQPVFPEGAGPVGGSLRLRIGEIGWQAAVPPWLAGFYWNAENVAVTDEARQAEIYAALVRSLRCDPAVSALHLFHLIDDADLRQLQTGLLRADRSARPSFESVRAAIAEPACAVPRKWFHATAVRRAAAYFDAGSLAFSVSAGEDAEATGALLRLPGPGAVSPAQAARAFAGRPGPAVVAAARGTVRAYRQTRFEFPSRIPPGWYALAVRLAAATSPQRTETLVSGVFRAGEP